MQKLNLYLTYLRGLKVAELKEEDMERKNHNNIRLNF